MSCIHAKEKGRRKTMANKTNFVMANGKKVYRIRRKVGMKRNKEGLWVDDIKTFIGKNKSEAESKYEAFKKDLDSGLTSEEKYFGQMADYYVYNVFLHDSSLAMSTREKYESAYKKHISNCPLAGIPLQRIKTLDIQNLYNSIDCSDSTLKAIHNLMRRFFSYLENGSYCRDITYNLVLPKKKKNSKYNSEEIVVWSDDEISRILKGLGSHRHRLTIIMALGTGLRISELLALKYSDIDGNKLYVKRQLVNVANIKYGEKTTHEIKSDNPKTSASFRSIPLSDSLLKEIEMHMLWHKKEMLLNGYRTEYIFTTKAGNFYDRHNVLTAFNRYHKKIGIPEKGIHVYRHTFGTKLCEEGYPIQVASKLLGHSSIGVTAKYYINIDDKQKKSAIDHLSKVFTTP